MPISTEQPEKTLDALQRWAAVEVEAVVVVAVAAEEEVGEQAPPDSSCQRTRWQGRRQQALRTTPGHVHRRQNEDQGVPDAVGTLLQSQSPLKYYGSTLFVMHALSHILQRTTYGYMGIHDQL